MKPSPENVPLPDVPAAEQPVSQTKFHLGGQALIEGVLMRSPHFVAAAVRRADGSIDSRVERFESVLQRHRWLRIPFIRGTIALVEMMFLGMRYLNWSAQVALEDSEAPPQATGSVSTVIETSGADGVMASADSAAGVPPSTHNVALPR
jgi:uncharacterized protein YqhQ